MSRKKSQGAYWLTPTLTCSHNVFRFWFQTFCRGLQHGAGHKRALDQRGPVWVSWGPENQFQRNGKRAVGHHPRAGNFISPSAIHTAFVHVGSGKIPQCINLTFIFCSALKRCVAERFLHGKSTCSPLKMYFSACGAHRCNQNDHTHKKVWREKYLI